MGSRDTCENTPIGAVPKSEIDGIYHGDPPPNQPTAVLASIAVCCTHSDEYVVTCILRTCCVTATLPVATIQHAARIGTMNAITGFLHRAPVTRLAKRSPTVRRDACHVARHTKSSRPTILNQPHHDRSRLSGLSSSVLADDINSTHAHSVGLERATLAGTPLSRGRTGRSMSRRVW